MFFNGEEVAATSSSLTISVSGSPKIELSPTAEGRFVDSGTETIEISTTHAAGYTLTVKSSDATGGNETALKDSSGNVGFYSIPSAISAETFDTSAYNGKWGYKPSKLNSTANTNYLPAPTTSGSIIDSVPDATSNAYTVSIGARADINSTIGNFSNTFVFTVMANPTQYTITYNTNATDAVSNMPDNAAGTSGIETVTLSSNVPTRTTGWYFNGWNTEQDGSGTSYAKGAEFALNQTSSENAYMLYAQWTDCRPGYICYKSNAGADAVVGAMADHSTGTTATSVMLRAYNYERDNYAFVGWSVKEDPIIGTDAIYGPMETISFSALADAGLNLYAVWLPKSTEYTMQTFSSSICSTELAATIFNENATNTVSLSGTTVVRTSTNFTVSANSLIALEDERDGDVYAVARLTDGNCWMLENLRLDNTATITSTNTHNPAEGFILSASSNSWCSDETAECIDQSMLNTNNMKMDGTYEGNWYAYGNYYNWYSATAGNGKYETLKNTVAGDICPINWKLPRGYSGVYGEFLILDRTMGGDAISNTSTTPTGAVMSARFRQFPNNFVYAGVIWSSVYHRGEMVRSWSSVAYPSSSNSGVAFHLYATDTEVSSGVRYASKNSGFSVRCLVNNG